MGGGVGVDAKDPEGNLVQDSVELDQINEKIGIFADLPVLPLKFANLVQEAIAARNSARNGLEEANTSTVP
jgi:hypothetical protein